MAWERGDREECFTAVIIHNTPSAPGWCFFVLKSNIPIIEK